MQALSLPLLAHPFEAAGCQLAGSVVDTVDLDNLQS